MMGTIKYLFLIGILAALYNAASCFDPSPNNLNIKDIIPEGVVFSSVSSSECPFINIPGQISLNSIGCLEESDRRTEKCRRHNFIFEKSGKIVSDSAGKFFQKKEVVINISITEHIHKLIYLGMLVI